MYVLVQKFESKHVIASNIEFEKNVKEYEFFLGGEITGIKLLSTGVLVIDIENEDTDLRVGDIILKVNGKSIESNNELIEQINKDNKLILSVKRDNEEKELEITPIYNPSTKSYELGLWIKDSCAGVGTITFYEKNNKLFGGLGHGITETEDNVIVPIKSGAIVKSEIKEINKGSSGNPGDIRGILYKDVEGEILKNTVNGIYGKVENEELIKNKKIIEVLSRNEVKEGKALVYCALDGKQVTPYEIIIEKVIYESKGNRSMVIHITDKELLDKTGGIIQGMSGSPIVQNGKLAGAITHVFLNDATRGYAVFIENMIEDIKGI